LSVSDVILIRTGTANLASVMAAMDKLNVPARISNNPSEIAQAERLILPGVGAFGPAMDRLRADGLVEPLRDRIEAGRPTLAICLGMQLLFDGSDETPGCAGLGVASGHIQRFVGNMRVPQMGWNRITADEGCHTLASGYVYFANSYRAVDIPAGWRGATADHGGRFVAAIERGAVVACQFHPELSGAFGLGLIARWLSMGACSC
jgi:imidazole glycerol phosphate synthase glutamine amidotransferase subunit